LTEFFFEIPPKTPANALRAVLETMFAADRGVYLGHDLRGWCHASPQQSVMVLGPPRSGKTTSLIIPNVIASPGAVISTSTKPDVLDATIGARSQTGRCLLFDPTGTTEVTGRVERLHWSPLQSCLVWTGALATARALVEVGTGAGGGSLRAEHSHWTERAQALLAPLLHAAALAEADMRTLLTWVDRRKALPAQQVLAAEAAPATELARNLLDGIVATEERELSGIWSTASGALAGFRSEHALEVTESPDFDPGGFVESSDTVYVAAPAHRQALVAPMVVGLVNDVRVATFARDAFAREAPSRDAEAASASHPVLLALDELANIAPIPDLPSMVSEGGGQGLITLACFQDLAQARQRWPVHAEGFPSLFGTTVVLPGIGDTRTLEALSLLGGEEELLVRSASAGRAPSDRPLVDLISGGRTQFGSTVATQWRRRLPVDVIARGALGYALAFDERNQAAWIPLAPSHSTEPWRTLRGWGLVRDVGRDTPAPSLKLESGRPVGNHLAR
jgi:type IV secretion system protein VirD4